MRVIYGIGNLSKFKKAVVALGVFDGIHLAHRRILRAAVKQARRIKGTCVALTFFPHPQKQDSLSSLEHRLRLISGLGVDVCLVVSFDKRFSRITAEDFVKDILIARLGAQHIYVGKNFRFGRGAKGDYKLLKRLSREYGFKLKISGIMKINNRAVSSTYIRRLIKKGDLAAAKILLNRPVSVLGTVIKGARLARGLGFPTANIDPHHEVLPPQGVYAARAIFNRRKYRGICYIGRKPTLAAGSPGRPTIEIYIFNFNKNIYGKELEIEFLRKLRNEKKFPSLNILARQISKDILQAEKVFSLPA